MAHFKNVLSLFDGKSCGQIALNRGGHTYEKYYASEIDKYAMTITQKNYPDTIQLGDVTNWRDWLDKLDFSKVDLVTGGFPCQAWSLAGKQNGDKDPRGMLFWVMLDIVKYIKSKNPDVIFLLENVKMKKDFEDYITFHTEEALGKVNKYLINSALVSAQTRKRFYWTNIDNVTQPKDKEIYLYQVLEGEHLPRRLLENNLILAGHANLNGHDANKRVYLPEGKAPTVTTMGGGHREPKVYKYPVQVNPCKKASGKQPYMQERVFSVSGKSHALTASFASRTKIQILGPDEWRKLTPLECERLQTVPDNYTEGVSNSQRYKMIGNGWTVDVIVHLYSFIDLAEFW